MATPQTPMLPGLGGGTGGAQLAPGQLSQPTAPMSLTNISIGTSPQPGAVNTSTPSPKPAPASTANAGNPQAPGLSAPGGAVPMGSLPMPTVNEALAMPNMVTDLVAQYGTQATPPATNSDLADKMNALHSTVKGTEAPPGNPMRSQAVQDSMTGMGTKPEVDPSASFIDGLASMNPVEKSIYDFYTDQFSHPAVQQSFEEEFNKAFTDAANPAGIPGESLSQEQMKMMNIKNIMDGTEDDIRNEITKAGGFATESQVQALTTARNKTLLKQANVLQQSMALKQDYVDQLMKFTEMDRASVEKALDRKLGIADKITDMTDKMDKASKDNYNKIIEQGGFKGLAEAMSGNATAMRAAEKTMGLPKGALQNPAFLDAMKDPNQKDNKFQFISGTANQQSGVFDPASGTFKPMGGGGGTGAGGGGAGGEGQIFSDALQNIMAFGGTGPQTRPGLIAQLQQRIASGDIQGAKEFIASTAIGNLPADQKNAAIGRNQALSSLTDIQGLLDAAKAKGATTGMLTGSLVDVYQKLGTTSNPDLNYISARMNTALQSYRRSMTGVAFGPQEAAEYKKIFPDLYSVDGLNAAKISALRDSFNAFNRAALSTTMGGGRVYDAIYGPPDTAVLPSDSAPPSIKEGDLVMVNGGLYQVAPDGDTINPYTVGSSVDFSQIKF